MCLLGAGDFSGKELGAKYKVLEVLKELARVLGSTSFSDGIQNPS